MDFGRETFYSGEETKLNQLWLEHTWKRARTLFGNEAKWARTQVVKLEENQKKKKKKKIKHVSIWCGSKACCVACRKIQSIWVELILKVSLIRLDSKSSVWSYCTIQGGTWPIAQDCMLRTLLGRCEPCGGLSFLPFNGFSWC